MSEKGNMGITTLNVSIDPRPALVTNLVGNDGLEFEKYANIDISYKRSLLLPSLSVVLCNVVCLIDNDKGLSISVSRSSWIPLVN